MLSCYANHPQLLQDLNLSILKSSLDLFLISSLKPLCIFICSHSTASQLPLNDDSVLDIAAFNVRIFGANKATDQTTMDILVKVSLRL